MTTPIDSRHTVFAASSLFLASLLSFIGCAPKYYVSVSQESPDFFADTSFANNANNYEIYVFSQGRVYKASGFQQQNDTAHLVIQRLDSLTASNVTSRPAKDRTKQVEIYLSDSLKVDGNFANETHLVKEDVLVVHRYSVTRQNPSIDTEHENQQTGFPGPALLVGAIFFLGLALIVYWILDALGFF